MRALLVLLLPFFLAACSKEPAQAPAAPAAPKADVVAGKIVAQGKCASCHGLDGMGASPDIPHLGGQKEAYMLQAFKEYKDGTRHHAALQQLMSELSPADTANVVAYYAGMPVAKPMVAVAASDPLEAGKQAAAACAACHGADGNSVIKGTPSLAGQHPGFLINATQAYKDGSRKDAAMAAQVARLDSTALEGIAYYLASQVPAGRGQPAAGDAKAGEPLSGKCGACHGANGQSMDAKTPSLAGQDFTYLVKTMKAYRDGARKHEDMKLAMAGSKDKDIEHIAAFYAVQPPKQAHDRMLAPTVELASRCDKCHGPAVQNPNMVVPRIEAQQAQYIENVLKAYRDNSRPQSTMHAMGLPLSDAEIKSIALHYAGMGAR